MLAFPSMVEEAARNAGMKVPEGDVNKPGPDATKEQFPHWFVYCALQLCRPITWGNHWENAKIIANIPEDQIRTLDQQQFYDLGFDP